jgi:hypothetical protein
MRRVRLSELKVNKRVGLKKPGARIVIEVTAATHLTNAASSIQAPNMRIKSMEGRPAGTL